MRRFLLPLLLGFCLGVQGAVPSGWKVRDGRPGTKVAPADLKVQGKVLVMPVELPGNHEYVLLTPSKTLVDAREIQIRFKVPKNMVGGATVTVFSKDNDHLWRQIRYSLSSLPREKDGIVLLSVPLAGQAAVRAWECCGHGRPWTGLTVANLVDFGFRFELDAGVKGACKGDGELVDVTVVKSDGWKLGEARDVSVDTLSPQVGKRIEVTFRLDGWVPRPYDSSHFKITADVVLPGDGKAVETVSGYYFEDFLYDETDADKVACLTAHGEPSYKVRYCPRVAGVHRMRIKVRQGKEELSLPEITFTAQKADAGYHGFVRVDKKFDQYFSHDDGTVFRGLGMNVRSPFDDRYFGVAPYSLWRDQGLQAYERLFRSYREIGINVAEVWMCSWWLALEWMNDAPGFHGVGHYNQYRAWMLDRIMQLAEENGIYVILVLNNHGKFGMTYDTEWARNPYNKALGGYLDKCEEYFVNPRAKADFKKTADYIVARWGNSPYLLSWKLFTEVDLTGQNIQAYLTDPNIPTWHAEMGTYLKAIDIYDHPVTTHWMLSYSRIDPRVAALKEIDFLSTDAYYYLGGGSQGMINLLVGGANYGKKHKKPMVITEFGGSSYADSMRNLMNQVEIGLWTGFFRDMGILPMYWWFGLVEDKKLHGYYRCLSRFEAGEDRRGMKYAPRSIAGAAPLRVHELRGKDRLFFWIMDSAFFFAAQENVRPTVQKGRVLSVPALPAAKRYAVEYWDTNTGEIVSRAELAAPKGKEPLKVALPEFKKSLAVKVKALK